jgi:predicted signal transduction protein with EAL and GGDEF domain
MGHEQDFRGNPRPNPPPALRGNVDLQLGRRLGKDVIAEGVETEEHAVILRAAGCRQAQGFYFARPMPTAALMDCMAAARDRAGQPLQAKAG